MTFARAQRALALPPPGLLLMAQSSALQPSLDKADKRKLGNMLTRKRCPRLTVEEVESRQAQGVSHLGVTQMSRRKIVSQGSHFVLDERAAFPWC